MLERATGRFTDRPRKALKALAVRFASDNGSTPNIWQLLKVKLDNGGADSTMGRDCQTRDPHYACDNPDPIARWPHLTTDPRLCVLLQWVLSIAVWSAGIIRPLTGLQRSKHESAMHTNY